MKFNTDPTKQATEILFLQKKSKPFHPELLFNGVPVAKVKHQKHLGLTLDRKLSFEYHLNEEITKIKKILGIIKHVSKYFPLKTLNKMYKSLVRSHLDYCDIIYHQSAIINPPPLALTLTTLMMEVEKIQYQAALAITGSWQGSSRTKLYEELGWETLSDCRNIAESCKFIRLRMKKLYLT